MKYKIEKDLDTLLFEIKNSKKYEEIKLAFDNEYFQALLLQLTKDELITDSTTAQEIKGGGKIITVKGLIFEGYVQQKKDVERVRKRNILNIWAVTFGGGGALIAGLYSLGLIATKIFSFFCRCHCR